LKQKSDQNQPSLVTIGKTVGSRGLAGQLRIHLFSGEAPWAKKVKKFVLIPPGKPPVTYLIETVQVSPGDKGKIFVKLKGVGDRTAADLLRGAEVQIDQTLLETEKGENFYLREIMGFSVTSKGEVLGTVVGFETNGAQDLIVVELPKEKGGKSVLIPLIKPFIAKMSFAEKLIEMDLPEGLVDLEEK
jgi:16S rRNA processing protein RimM